MLAKKPEGEVYRVTFHLAGQDPRIALRERADLGADDLAALIEAPRSSRQPASRALDRAGAAPHRRARGCARR